MIQINNLYISEGNTLNIDVEVKDLSYYADVYIDTIKIDNQETFLSSGPSSTPIYVYTAGATEKSKVLNLTDVNINGGDLSKDLLFVYITTKGNPSSDTPCGEDNKVTTGIVIYMYPIYNKGLVYSQELVNNCGCKISKMFIDFILQLNAFELAIKLNDCQKALTYWQFLSNNIDSIVSNSTCDCNG